MAIGRASALVVLLACVVAGCIGPKASPVPGGGREALPTAGAQPWVEGLAALPAYRAEPARASGRFARDCARCHGARGAGNGAFGRAMIPPPTNFRDADYMRRQRPSYYHDAIVDGVTASGMPSWGHALDDEQAWDMTFYVWSLDVTNETLASGGRTYARRCEECHGQDGAGEAGRSFADPSRVGASRLDDAEALERAHPEIAESLSDEETRALVEYLWTFLYLPPGLQDPAP